MDLQHNQRRIAVGAIILLAGLALLFGNLGLFDFEIKRYILRWPMILIVLGVIFMLSHDKRGPGIVLFVIGSVFYLRDFFEFGFNFWQVFWPSMLILAGILILFRHRIDSYHCQKKKSERRQYY